MGLKSIWCNGVGRALAVVGALAATAPAWAAANPDELRVAGWAATCANCHGTQGRAVAGTTVPGLAGQPAAYLAEQLKAYKRGERPATVMHQLARGYTDAQLEAIAAYFAAQTR